jgi:hypothetical protein
MMVKDAFDRWWEWASKPLDSPLTISAELHHAVTALSPEDQRDRAKVNRAAARKTAQNVLGRGKSIE